MPKPVGHISNVTYATAESPAVYAADSDTGDMPPPPDNFPAGWDSEWQPSFENAALAARREPKRAKVEEPVTPPQALEPPPASPPVGETGEGSPEETGPAPTSGIEATVGQIDPSTSLRAGNLSHTETFRNEPPILPSLYIPLAETEDREHPPQQITILLRPSGDAAVDKRRIKTIYGTLISFHGRDRFTFQIFENGKGHLIDFPNDTTRICPELLARLKKVVGDESWRIEPILLQ